MVVESDMLGSEGFSVSLVADDGVCRCPTVVSIAIAVARKRTNWGRRDKLTVISVRGVPVCF